MESAESLLRDQIPAAAKVNESTKMALQDAVLSPRFYTTNFDEMRKELLKVANAAVKG